MGICGNKTKEKVQEPDQQMIQIQQIKVHSPVQMTPKIRIIVEQPPSPKFTDFDSIYDFLTSEQFTKYLCDGAILDELIQQPQYSNNNQILLLAIKISNRCISLDLEDVFSDVPQILQENLRRHLQPSLSQLYEMDCSLIKNEELPKIILNVIVEAFHLTQWYLSFYSIPKWFMEYKINDDMRSKFIQVSGKISLELLQTYKSTQNIKQQDFAPNMKASFNHQKAFRLARSQTIKEKSLVAQQISDEVQVYLSELYTKALQYVISPDASEIFDEECDSRIQIYQEQIRVTVKKTNF